jgi:hypothetical protein
MSIKVFFLLPKDIQKKLIHLINLPESIIETLLINMRFDIIKTIYTSFPNLRNEELITFYAEKAMSFSGINSGVIPEQEGDDFVIIYENIRNNYNFKSAPNFDLFKKFMNLCNKIDIISNVCFDVSNNCSKYLLEKNPNQPKILFINFITKVLSYLAKRLNGAGIDKNSEHFKKLEFYQKLIELFKEFIDVRINRLTI